MLLKKHAFDTASLSPLKHLEERGEMVLKTASMWKMEGVCKNKV